MNWTAFGVVLAFWGAVGGFVGAVYCVVRVSEEFGAVGGISVFAALVFVAAAFVGFVVPLP